jgi:hypothetical protein
MRPSLSLLIIGAMLAAAAQAQTAVTTPPAGTRAAASRPAAPGPAATRSVAVPGRAPGTADPAGQARSRRSPGLPVPGAAQRRAGPAGPAAKGGGVLALGATDITGNKELPKVMVIVPWKSPTDAGGVLQPRDSLLNELLQPVDRGVFQRRIRYYGQLDRAGEQPGGARVTPVGDGH